MWFVVFFFFQAEDGIRDLVRSRGLGDVYKRQTLGTVKALAPKYGIDTLLKAFALAVREPGTEAMLSLIHI